MAAVPGVLLIGDYSVQGGGAAPGHTSFSNVVDHLTLQTPLIYLNDREIMRIVPDVPATKEPAGTFKPWYDQNQQDTSYIISSSTTTTITVAGTPWTNNQWAGRIVTVVNNGLLIAGAGFETRILVISNTTNELTFAAQPAPPPAGAIMFLGQGRFSDYHPAAGWITAGELGALQFSKRGGSSPQTGGQGTGPDATLVRALYEDVYPDSPYFYCWKWGNTSPVNSGWGDAPNNSARALFLSELTRVAAAATADGGNTVAWEVAIIDNSYVEMLDWAATPANALVYEARLREMITWLKSASVLNNANLKVLLVSHRSDLLTTSAPGAAPFARSVHAKIATDTDGVGILDCEGYKASDWDEAGSAEVKFYAQAEYFRMGREMAAAINRLKLGTASTVSSGLPVYLFLGDSICVGEIEQDWTEKANSVALSGPTPGSLLRPVNQLIWNRGLGVAERYNPHTNSNTSGSAVGTAGPELSIMAELGDMHPDGFLLIKRGSYSSGLDSALAAYNPGTGAGGRWTKSRAEHYDELLQDFADATQYVNNTLGKQVDVRGVFVILGHNDNSVTGGGAAFAAALEQFVDDLRADFTTRTSGDPLPIVWRQPMDDVAGVVPAEMAAIRRALLQRAQADSEFRVINVDDLEVDRDDGLHETPETAVTVGRRMFTAMRRLMA